MAFRELGREDGLRRTLAPISRARLNRPFRGPAFDRSNAATGADDVVAPPDSMHLGQSSHVDRQTLHPRDRFLGVGLDVRTAKSRHALRSVL